ncbi:MAG: LD-carboxypeptidase [Rubrivivax sp.]|nr:LD-carboxypeptidase [Rubrivivax sp.]
MTPPIRYPAPLTPGCRIVVTAPSAGVTAPLHRRLDLALGHLRAQGFIVEEGRCLRDNRQGASAPAAERAAELMASLLRDDVDAVFPPWGGELAIELLDRLDWTALGRARPKWLIGYSDTSTLLLALTLRLGWASAHGPCLMDLVPGQDDLLTASALASLAAAPGTAIVQQQSARWQRQWTDFAVDPGVVYRLTEPTQWRCLNRSGSVEASGRLIGGCIDTLMHLAGSVHADLPAFVARCAGDGALLYLENAEMSPTALVRALHQLRWAGWFDGLAGLMIGRSAAPDAADDTALHCADALAGVLAALHCPVLADVDIGHQPPQLMLVNGALATLRWQADGVGSLTQRLI